MYLILNSQCINMLWPQYFFFSILKISISGITVNEGVSTLLFCWEVCCHLDYIVSLALSSGSWVWYSILSFQNPELTNYVAFVFYGVIFNMLAASKITVGSEICDGHLLLFNGVIFIFISRSCFCASADVRRV